MFSRSPREERAYWLTRLNKAQDQLKVATDPQERTRLRDLIVAFSIMAEVPTDNDAGS